LLDELLVVDAREEQQMFEHVSLPVEPERANEVRQLL
jgi:hypothetical protein